MPANKNGSPNEVQKGIRLGFIIVLLLLLLLFKSENTMHTNSGTTNVNYDWIQQVWSYWIDCLKKNLILFFKRKNNNKHFDF